MKSNLIPITGIYNIYPKYTYSNDVRKFMDEIVDIDRADVYSKNEVITMFEEIQSKIEQIELLANYTRGDIKRMGLNIIQDRIDKLRRAE